MDIMKKIIFFVILIFFAAMAITVFYRKNSDEKKQTQLQLNAEKNMQKYALFESNPDPKFSFSYPLFDNWEIDTGETPTGEMWVRYIPGKSIDINFETPPGLYFRFLKSPPGQSLWQKAVLNSKGTRFIDAGNENNTASFRSVFQIKDKFLEITDPRGAKHANFDGNLVWKTVIDSVKAE
jgi:hypothetical protein